MPVYVDSMKAPLGKMIMCHMIADTDEELHAMADAIGVSRKWHQAPPKHTSHYDICKSKRALAVKQGAIEVSWRDLGAMEIRRRITGELGSPSDAYQWVKDHMASLKKENAQ